MENHKISFYDRNESRSSTKILYFFKFFCINHSFFRFLQVIFVLKTHNNNEKVIDKLENKEMIILEMKLWYFTKNADALKPKCLSYFKKYHKKQN